MSSRGGEAGSPGEAVKKVLRKKPDSLGEGMAEELETASVDSLLISFLEREREMRSSRRESGSRKDFFVWCWLADMIQEGDNLAGAGPGGAQDGVPAQPRRSGCGVECRAAHLGRGSRGRAAPGLRVRVLAQHPGSQPHTPRSVPLPCCP